MRPFSFLLNICYETIMEKMFDFEIARIKCINIPENEEDLEGIMNKMTLYGEEYGVTLNNKTTKFMRISKSGNST